MQDITQNVENCSRNYLRHGDALTFDHAWLGDDPQNVCRFAPNSLGLPRTPRFTSYPLGIPEGWPSLASTINLNCGLVTREHVSHLGYHSGTKALEAMQFSSSNNIPAIWPLASITRMVPMSKQMSERRKHIHTSTQHQPFVIASALRDSFSCR